MLYGLLNMPSVQNYIKERIVLELKTKLNTNLGIESLSIQPFNIIQLNGVYLNDRQDSTILKAEKIYADFELLPLIDNKLIITAAKLSDFDAVLSKDSTNAPLNIQFVIDAFKPKNNNKKTKLDVQINSVNIADGRFKFEIKDKIPNNQKFDPNHISVSNLNAKLALKSLSPDSLNIQIKKLELEEKSGFKINNLIVRLITQDQHLYVKGFRLDLPKSRLEFEKCEIDLSDTTATKDLISNAIFETKISSSYITFNDVAAFVPAFRHFQDRILFKTEIKGKIDSINVSNITLDYGDKMHLEAKGLVSNIRDKDNLYLDASVDKLTITKDGIIGLMNNFSEQKKELPKELINLGTVSFTGNIAGYLKQLKAKGHLSSELGNLDANLDFGFKPTPHIASFFKGKVSTNNFELGKLLNNKDLGDIAFNLEVDLAKPSQGKMGGLVKGLVDKFTFKQYVYQNIDINGKYDGLRVEGQLGWSDDNGLLDINGLFDLSQKDPELNFKARLKHVRLDKLNLSNKYKESYLSLHINADFTGKNIDDIQGDIKMDSIRFLQPDKKFEMDNFIINASGYENDRKLLIQSDIINGQVLGTYSFSTIAQSIQRTLNYYLPSLISFKENKKKKIKDNDLTFDLTINNTENASEVFQLPVIIYSPTKIIGFYNNKSEHFKLEAYMPSLKAGGSKIQSGYLIVENSDEQIKSNLSATFVTKNNTQNNLSTDITIQNDIINMNTSFLNQNQDKLKGQLANTITFSKPNKKTLQTDIAIEPGELVLNNTSWKIEKSHIRILPKDIKVDNFFINNPTKDQQLTINGTYSTKDEDKQLLVTLKNIDLDYIFMSLAIDALQFQGSASGVLAVSSIESQPYADINLDVQDFGFNKTRLGNLKLHSELDAETKKVNLEGTITNAQEKLTNISGNIDPVNQKLSINFDAEEIDIAFLNKYSESLFNDVKGIGTGNIHLFGNFSKVTVEGKAFIQNGELGINFLNARYNFTDTIYLKKDLIYFNDLTLNDQKGNTATVSGKVVHDYFSDFIYYVDLKGNNFMLYNATEKLNPLFYGTVFGSGFGVIKGDEKAVDININMQTQTGTHVYMNFMEDKATEYSFITYKTKETNDSIQTSPFKLSKLKSNSGMEINMNFYIDATPDATVELLMDPVGGDKLKGTGSGAMQFVWGTAKDPMLYGTYQIHSGSYNFTFQKIMERKFTIQEGSYVQFRGDPFQANLDVTAKYRVVANLFDLDRNLVQTTGQTSIPVNCVLNLTGALRQPNVKLDIELPSTDPEIARQIKNLISSEDMINRQIAYLLILSKFYTPNYADTDQKTNDFASLASATLSTQIGKILNGIDDRWQVGTNIRTSDSNFSSTEVELLLSSRLLNDRVLFNGNFGYRDNPLTQDAFIGDVDIEVLLNRLGTWRLKAYNHYNEKYYYINNSSIQTQGIGLLYKRDFDHFRELFQRPKKTKSAPIDTIKTNKRDSLIQQTSFVKMKE